MAIGRGIEFGTRSYKAALVERGSRGVLVKKLFVTERPLAAEGSAGEDPAWIAHAEDIAGSNCVLGVGSRDLMMRYARFPLVPPWRLRMMAEYEMEEAGRSANMEVVGDYTIVHPPGGPSEGLTVMSALARKETVSDGFNRAGAGGFKAKFATPAAVALFIAYRESTLLSRDEITLLIDVGYEASSVAIAGPGGLFFARNVSDGIFRLVKAVDGALGVGLERAEAFLRERVDLTSTLPPDASTQHKNAHQAALGALSQLASTVVGTIRFAQTTLKLKTLDINRVIVSGGGVMIPGVVQAIAKNVGKEPVVFRVGEHIPVGPEVAPALAGPRMVIPVGLALAAAELEPMLAMVPPEVAAKQDFWRRRILYYISPVAAAVIIVAAAVVANVKAEGAAAAVVNQDQQVGAMEKEAERIQESAKKLNAEYTLYDTLRRLAAPSALLAEVMTVLHANATTGLKYTAVYTEGASSAGTISVNVEGVSLKNDAEVVLQELAGLTRAIKGLSYVENATSTTVDDKKRAGTGIPFNMTIKLKFASEIKDAEKPAEDKAAK